MAKYEFKLPDIGEGVAEGEIVSWLVDVGDVVVENQDIVEVMTDKATVTIGAPRAGQIAELRAKPGDMVPVGSVLVVFDLSSADAGAPNLETAPSTPPTVVGDTSGGPVGDLRDDLPGMASAPQEAAASAQVEHFAEQALAAPATRRLARELGVDLRRVPPTGKAGRVTPEDVRAFAQTGGSQATPAAAGPAAAPSAVAEAVPTSTPVIEPAAPVPTAAGEERIPVRGMRRRIFENMARSKRTAAHFNYVEECDVSRLMTLRERTQAVAAAQGVKLTYLPFILKAVVTALQRHPALNCLVDDASLEVVRRSTYDIGIAVATDAGLIVPVLRGVDRLSMLDIALELERLAEAARSGKTQPQDLGGSSFTVTSLGRAGGFLAPPIINYPEVGIMGVHAIKKRPVVRDDEIVIGNVMMLSWSFDHRWIDGHVGAAFAQEIVALLEDPERLLVSMR